MKRLFAVLLVFALALPLTSCASADLDYQTLVQLEENVELLQATLEPYVQADESLTAAQKENRLRTGAISLTLIEKLKAQAKAK